MAPGVEVPARSSWGGIPPVCAMVKRAVMAQPVPAQEPARSGRKGRLTMLHTMSLLQTFPRSPEDMARLPCPIMCNLLSWEVMRVAMSCKSMYFAIAGAVEIWEFMVERERCPLAMALAQRYAGARGDRKVRAQKIRRAYREAHKATKLSHLEWHDVAVTGDTVRKQEGHAAAALMGGRLIAVVGGWSSLTHIENDVTIADTANLPQRVTWHSAESVGRPADLCPVYGMAVAAVAEDSFVVYGGLQYPGYKGDVNHLSLVRITQCNGGSRFLAEWRQPETGGESGFTPTSRGYPSVTHCTSAAGTPRSTSQLVVFGGIHQGAATAALEVLDLTSMVWAAPKAAGAGPPPRFGHSATYVPESHRVLVAGGSNGSDLLRNGEDLQDVWVLAGLDRGTSALAWSRVHPGGDLQRKQLGRCHTAARVGPHLLFFGGHCRVSNKTVGLNLESMEWKQPGTVLGPLPPGRHAHAAVAVGRNLLVYGGWNGTSLSSMHVALVGGSGGAGVLGEVELAPLQEEEDMEGGGEGARAGHRATPRGKGKVADNKDDLVPEYGWGITTGPAGGSSEDKQAPHAALPGLSLD